MADNTLLNSGSGGNTLRTLEDGSSIHWPVGVVAYATTVGTPDVLSIPTAAALADNTSNPTTLLTGSCLMVYDGTNWDMGRGDSTDGLLVNLGTNNDVTVTGTVTANLSATDNAVLDQIEVNTSYGDQTGGGVEASALRVTIANDSTGVISVDDGGGTLTVDGTVTANLSATDNAVLDQIDSNTDYGAVTGGGVEATALRVTIANDSTGVLSIDDNGGSLTVDGTVTANLSATDNAVLDQIDSNTDYGAVVGGGVEATALRVTLANDSTGTLTVDTTGTSGLEVIQSTAADLNVTEASAASILTAVQLIDNIVAVLGTATYSEATTSGAVVGAVRNNELATLANTDNEIAPLQVNENGAVYVSETTVAPSSASGVAASSGDTAIVAAGGAGIKIRIHAIALFSTSATVTNVYLHTTTDTDVLGNSGNPIPLATDADGDNVAGFVLPWNPGGWTTTSTGNEALNLNLSAAQDVIYAITYSYVS